MLVSGALPSASMKFLILELFLVALLGCGISKVLQVKFLFTAISEEIKSEPAHGGFFPSVTLHVFANEQKYSTHNLSWIH